MPDFQKSVQDVLDKALHGNETSNYELEFCSASEEIRFLLVNATTRRDAENHIVGVVGVVSHSLILLILFVRVLFSGCST
jgi:hypothetical protein